MRSDMPSVARGGGKRAGSSDHEADRPGDAIVRSILHPKVCRLARRIRGQAHVPVPTTEATEVEQVAPRASAGKSGAAPGGRRAQEQGAVPGGPAYTTQLR